MINSILIILFLILFINIPFYYQNLNFFNLSIITIIPLILSKNKKNIIILLIIFIIYDILYSNIFFLSFLLHTIIILINLKILNKKSNYLIIIINILLIIFYDVIIFLANKIVINYDLSLLIMKIEKTIIFNFVFLHFLFLSRKKKDNKKIKA